VGYRSEQSGELMLGEVIMRKIQTQGLAALVAFGVSCLNLSSVSASSQPRPLTMLGWQAQLGQTPAVGSGCFQASFPALVWHAAMCVAAPEVPLAPAPSSLKGASDTVGGNGSDYAAVVSGLISKATGTFTDVSSNISEQGKINNTGNPKPNQFSLQLNSEFFHGSPTCAGAITPSNCQAWQQFVYLTSSNSVFMQYWLINYNASCPAGWTPYSSDCYTNSMASNLSGSALTAKSLATVSLSGSAAPGGNDEVELVSATGQATLATGEDQKLYLATYWNKSEWGVYGDGNSGAAVFGNGDTLEAVTTLTATGSLKPCIKMHGFTAETNNLKLAATPALGSESSPTMASKQTDGTAGIASCEVAGSSTVAPWSVVSSPDTSSSENELLGVSCASSGFCMAVGDYYDAAGSDQTLIEAWNGSIWSIVSSPNSGSGYNVLQGVTCASSSFCMATGYYVDATGIAQTLIEIWNGSNWSILSSPNSGSGDNILYGVSCVSSSFCVAAGGSYGSSIYASTLIEAWNGNTWSIVSSPNTSGVRNELLSVTCVSGSFCVAAGDYVITNNRTLIEAWNGTKWSIVNSPNPPVGGFDSLHGVSCVSSSFCVAAGESNGGGDSMTLIEAWNGSSWSVVSSPNTAIGFNTLDGVSCISRSFCMAAGTGPYSEATLIEAWNGSSWIIMSSPNPGSEFNIFASVSCTGGSFCVASGDYADSLASQETLIEDS
jgi:hypothetical protein